MFNDNREVSAGASCVPSPARETEVNSELGKLANAIDILSDRLGILGNRLDGVLSSPKPTNEKEPTEVPRNTKLASAIQSQTSRIRNLSKAVDECISRLEL